MALPTRNRNNNTSLRRIARPNAVNQANTLNAANIPNTVEERANNRVLNNTNAAASSSQIQQTPVISNNMVQNPNSIAQNSLNSQNMPNNNGRKLTNGGLINGINMPIYDVTYGYPKNLAEPPKSLAWIKGRLKTIDGIPYEMLPAYIQEDLDRKPTDDNNNLRIFVKDSFYGPNSISYIEFGSAYKNARETREKYDSYKKALGI